MLKSSLCSVKIKAKLLQKAKLKSDKNFALKDALAIISKSAGYRSWKEMKDSYDESDIFNPPNWSAHWKTWFANIDEARENLKLGHYLIPYQKQFFLCDSDYLKALGLDSNDPDLLKVGNDWSSPKDLNSWSNLKSKIKRHHNCSEK